MIEYANLGAKYSDKEISLGEDNYKAGSKTEELMKKLKSMGRYDINNNIYI